MPLKAEYAQLSRQFWVTKEEVKKNKYDLSASRYRQVGAEETYYERPAVTLERLLLLERKIEDEIIELQDLNI